jgi:hypothetical protein
MALGSLIYIDSRSSAPLLATKCDREFPIHLCHRTPSCTAYSPTLSPAKVCQTTLYQLLKPLNYEYSGDDYQIEPERNGQIATL